MQLKELRKKKKLSQAKLAEMCGTSQTHYSGIEKGERRPSVDLAKRIADVLDFEWTEFYQ